MERIEYSEEHPREYSEEHPREHPKSAPESATESTQRAPEGHPDKHPGKCDEAIRAHSELSGGKRKGLFRIRLPACITAFFANASRMVKPKEKKQPTPE
ncbi:hypothetical protein D3C78_1744440 [compost metagenome]